MGKCRKGTILFSACKSTALPTLQPFESPPMSDVMSRPAARTRHIVKPKIMAPPVLRMPTFTAPAPFCPSEVGKPKEAPAQEIEKPAPPKEEKKEPGHHLNQ